MNEHTITAHIGDGHTWFSIECPYDVADRERPCWAVYYNGDKAETCDECVYQAYLDDCGADVIAECQVTFAASVEWDADSPTFTLGAVIHAPDSPQGKCEGKAMTVNVDFRRALYRLFVAADRVVASDGDDDLWDAFTHALNVARDAAEAQGCADDQETP